MDLDAAPAVPRPERRLGPGPELLPEEDLDVHDVHALLLVPSAPVGRLDEHEVARPEVAEGDGVGQRRELVRLVPVPEVEAEVRPQVLDAPSDQIAAVEVQGLAVQRITGLVVALGVGRAYIMLRAVDELPAQLRVVAGVRRPARRGPLRQHGRGHALLRAPALLAEALERVLERLAVHPRLAVGAPELEQAVLARRGRARRHVARRRRRDLGEVLRRRRRLFRIGCGLGRRRRRGGSHPVHLAEDHRFVPCVVLRRAATNQTTLPHRAPPASAATRGLGGPDTGRRRISL